MLPILVYIIFMMHNKVKKQKIIIFDDNAFTENGCKRIFDQLCRYPNNEIIKILLNTHGGTVLYEEKILKKLLQHDVGYIAYIKEECYSAGTIIALGAKEIVMNNDSYMGKIDPIIVSDKSELISLRHYNNLCVEHITDSNIMYVKKWSEALNETMYELKLIFKNNPNIIKNISDPFIFSDYPHFHTYNMCECQDMGLPVRQPTLVEEWIMHL